MNISSLKEKYKNILGNKKSYLVKVPLRISPPGAHIDHQNGIVSGMTINKYIYLLFSENKKRDYFKKYKEKLPENLRRRAEHFYSEMEKLEKGIGYWEKGDIEKFGELMKESGESSIKNYECGIPQTIEIHKILNS